MEELSSNDRWTYRPVSETAVQIFRMAWQLESWLRLFVYVELRAARLDWDEPIKVAAERMRQRDNVLHHMATPHEQSLSYLSFGQLWEIIADPVD